MNYGMMDPYYYGLYGANPMFAAYQYEQHCQHMRDTQAAAANWTGQVEAVQQDSVYFHSWKNYDMLRFKQVMNESHGSSTVFHVYHSLEGKRSRDAALNPPFAGPLTDSCFGDFFHIAPDDLNNPNFPDWSDVDSQHTDQELLRVRRSHFPVLHHFVSMEEATRGLLCGSVVEHDYISIVREANGMPLLFKSFGIFDKENNQKFLDDYKAGVIEAPHKLKIKPSVGPAQQNVQTTKKQKNPRPLVLHWNDMVWDRNSSRETPKKNPDFGIMVMKGTQEAIDQVKDARRNSPAYLKRFPKTVSTAHDVVDTLQAPGEVAPLIGRPPGLELG